MDQLVFFYADDDFDDRLLFKEAAEDFPATVVTFENGEIMISALVDFMPRPSIIFLDLNMPRKSGFDIVKEIKGFENLHNIPIVILSTATDRHNVEMGRNCGANYYIPKSTSFHKLRSSLHHAFKKDWRNFKPSQDDFLHTW